MRLVKDEFMWETILSGVMFREFKVISNIMATFPPPLRDVTIREQD